MTDRGTGQEPADKRADDLRDTGEAEDTALEAELRRLLRESVEPLEPSPHALQELRRAVPERRRRRRHLLLGTAASVALLGVGVPLAFQSAATVSGDGGASASAGQEAHSGAVGEESHGHPNEGSDPVGRGSTDPGQSTGGDSGQGYTEGGSRSPSDDETDILSVTSPDCAREQLGGAEAWTEEPDASGTVYGTIRLANVSAQSCRVDGTGELTVVPFGATTTADVQILHRTEGDRATELPVPDETQQELILPPGAAYEVRFAWVPDPASARSCAVGGTGPGPTSEPAPPPGATPQADDTAADGTADGGGTGGSGGSSGSGAGGGEEPADGDPGTGGGPPPPGDDAGGTGSTGGEDTGGGSPGGVALRYTPSAGEPQAAEIVLEGVCSGTVYRTGVLEAPAG